MIIKVNNTALHYEIKGENNEKTIIMLHGNNDNGSYFTSQIKFFSENYKVITIDSRGQGKSAWGGEKLTISLLSDDIIAFCKDLKIKEAIFLAFSDNI